MGSHLLSALNMTSQNLLSFFLISVMVSSSFQFTSLSSTEVENIKKKIRTVVRGSTLPTAVRLAFHDCVGGCDGCLNVNNPDNAGLSDLVDSLDTVYTTNGYDSVLSRADFWALAGVYAVDKTIELNNDDCDEDDCAVPDSGLVFQWGRTDCDTAPHTDVDVHLPSALLNHSSVVTFFANEFGFDENETVALLGAHTLGRASSDNSGFSGTWIVGEANFFNNEYYKKLVDSGLSWRHRDAGTDNWQWNVQGEVFMLNVDVALYKDILVDSVGESSCDFTNCADAPTAAVVEAFAASNDVWISEFTKVFTKMQAHGNFTLNDLS